MTAGLTWAISFGIGLGGCTGCCVRRPVWTLRPRQQRRLHAVSHVQHLENARDVALDALFGQKQTCTDLLVCLPGT